MALPIENPIGCPAIICGSYTPSRYAEPLPLAAIGISATIAVMWRYRITPAGIGIAPNVRPYGKRDGSKLAVRIFCPLNTSMSSLAFPQN
jgi:hypothetical protein